MTESPRPSGSENSDAASATGWDEWASLYANRDEIAVAYADMIDRRGLGWPEWKSVNAAIRRRWSLSALTYIKRQAWMRVSARYIRERAGLAPVIAPLHRADVHGITPWERLERVAAGDALLTNPEATLIRDVLDRLQRENVLDDALDDDSGHLEAAS